MFDIKIEKLKIISHPVLIPARHLTRNSDVYTRLNVFPLESFWQIKMLFFLKIFFEIMRRYFED